MALVDLNGQWIDRFHDRNGLKYIVLERTLVQLARSGNLAVKRQATWGMSDKLQKPLER